MQIILVFCCRRSLQDLQGRKKGICGHKLDNRGCQHQRSHVQVDYPGNIVTLFMFSHLPGTNVGAVTRWDLLRKVSLYKFMVSFYFAKVTLYFNNVELGSLLGAKVQKLSSVKILRLIIQYFFKLINHWTVQCRWCWLGIRPDKSWGGYQDKTGNSIFQQPGVPTPTYAGNIRDWSKEHQQGEGDKPVFRLGE